MFSRCSLACINYTYEQGLFLIDNTKHSLDLTEFQICCALKDYADVNQLVCIHIPNEGLRTKWTGHRLKRIGLLPGTADYFFPEGNISYKGLWLEVKTLKGKPSIAQKSFIAMVNNMGYYGTIGSGLDACISVIKTFYDL